MKTKYVVVAVLAAALLSTLGAQTQKLPIETKAGAGRGGRIAPPARIIQFEARPASIQPGQSVTLIWATENPSGLTIAPELGRVAPRGNRTLTPKATTTYTMSLTGPAGDTVTATVTVNVAGTTAIQTSGAAAGSRETPRMADGKPDLSGVYNFGGGGGAGGRGAAGAAAAPAGPELKPGAESFRVVRGPTEAGPLSNCMPVAGPAAFTVPYQFQIIQNKDTVIILHEYPNTHRIIPTNGATHPVDPDPTWLGDSIGRWEGDTLVVDTIGYNTNTEIQGFKHTESLHIVERFSRPSADTLDYEATIEDPNVWARPWSVKRSFPVRPDLVKIDEFICENNKEYQHLFAK
jgi:hypothetical protein